MDHAKKMPGGTGSMMSQRKTLGSMMNPRPMQFAMGAKMYQDGVGSVDRPMLQGLPGVRSSQEVLFEKFAQGYMPQTASEIQMHRKYKSGDFVTPSTPNPRKPAGVSTEGYSKEELDQLAKLKEAFEKAGGMNTPEGRKLAAQARALQDNIPLAEVYERYADEFAEVPNIPEDVERQMPSNVPGVLPIGQRQMPSNVPGAPPTKDMMRKLKEYLKGGKSEAGLKALAASNPNLTYKEATAGMRLIKDPVGMKSAGEGRKMYQNGTGDAEGGPAYMGADKPGGRMYRDDLPDAYMGQEGRIDPNDPGFQEFLKNYGGEYFPEYRGMPIGGATGGGSIFGQSKYGKVNPGSGVPYVRGDRSAGYFDVLGAKHGSDMMHNLAVNPAMFAFDIEGDDTPSFLNRPLQGGIEGATNRDLAISAIERYNQNLAAEQAYRDYLDKQQGPTEGGKSYQVIRRPGQSDAFIVTE